MLPAKHRLTKRKDFDALFKRGKVIFGRQLQVRIMRTAPKQDSRLAIVISTKTEKTAVRRNRAKRQVREIIRQRVPQLRPGFDAAISIRPSFLPLAFAKKQEAVLAALHKAGLLT